ncbi:MAG: hypothetical protein HKO66_00695 [Saprospiraceae bacterium]|nr:PD40 domain-containing protein [Bacteroidia bacterium]NNL90724.1 hypothetical protein [Saprospiraceae bacterium]
MIKQTCYVLLLLSIFTSCKKNNEKIIFSSSRNGNSDIYVMDEEGKNQVPLTTEKTEEWGPTWINESEISFLRQTKDSIFRIKLNLITGKESKLKHPKNCLLDDKNVLYSGKLELYTCKSDIFLFDSRTNNTINLTENMDGVANYPSWSYNGKSVVFTSNHLGTNQVFEYNIDSKNVIQLTNSNANNERGELSPNRKFLVYSSDYFEKGNQDIVLKELQNGKIKNLSKSLGMELIARFSNDGNKIFFGTNKDDNWEIYVYDIDTERQTRLTDNKEFDGDPRTLKNK